MSLPLETVPATAIGRVPYLNMAPFFDGLNVNGGWQWLDVVPRQLGEEAKAGRVIAGPMAVADYLRQSEQFERLGPLGVAVRGRAHSVLLLSRKPIRQLDDATIAVTEQTSTSVLLLRLILEQRYELKPKAYERGPAGDADAVLLIGDDALRAQADNRTHPFEVDLAFEWWLWQHLPAVFAVWVIRKDASAEQKQQLSRFLQRQLAVNLSRLDAIATDRAASMKLPADRVKAYLQNFIYRLSEPEEQGLAKFSELVDAHHLL